MSELTVDGIRLSLEGAAELPLSAVLRESPAYDGPRNFFSVVLENASDRARSLPFDEIKRNIVLVYRNPAKNTEEVDNRTPPPRMDGAVERLAPGERKSFPIVFEYPAGIATMENRVAVLRFCARWAPEWLRASAYSEGSYDWNAGFEVCTEIRILDDMSRE